MKRMTLNGQSWGGSKRINDQFFRIKHRKLTLIIKIVFGLFMLSGGVEMLIENPRPGDILPGFEGRLGDWFTAVINTGYLYPWCALFKTVDGILLLIPRTGPFAILAAFPFWVNILLFTIFLGQEFYHLTIPAFLAVCYLLYAYSDWYRSIFVR